VAHYPRPLRLNISDKNRRYIGKYQSKRPPKGTQRTRLGRVEVQRGVRTAGHLQLLHHCGDAVGVAFGGSGAHHDVAPQRATCARNDRSLQRATRRNGRRGGGGVGRRAVVAPCARRTSRAPTPAATPIRSSATPQPYLQSHPTT
jgi:hypothetical protein